MTPNFGYFSVLHGLFLYLVLAGGEVRGLLLALLKETLHPNPFSPGM